MHTHPHETFGLVCHDSIAVPHPFHSACCSASSLSSSSTSSSASSAHGRRLLLRRVSLVNVHTRSSLSITQRLNFTPDSFSTTSTVTQTDSFSTTFTVTQTDSSSTTSTVIQTQSQSLTPPSMVNI